VTSGDSIIAASDVLDESFAKAMLGCVIGAIGAALLFDLIAMALVFVQFTVTLLVVVIIGCLVVGAGTLFNFGNVIPRR
jgi:hypothetical protein